MSKNKKLKFNKNGTVDIPTGKYNLSDIKEKFSIHKFLRRIFHFHKYHNLGIMEFEVGEVIVYGKKYKLNGQKLELFVCGICNKIKAKVIKKSIPLPPPPPPMPKKQESRKKNEKV